MNDEELLEQLPSQCGAQQLSGVVIPHARGAGDMLEVAAQRIVDRKHHGEVELRFHAGILTLSVK